MQRSCRMVGWLLLVLSGWGGMPTIGWTQAPGTMSTVAGSGPIGDRAGSFSGDGGLATQALLSLPEGITVDQAGDVYFADNYNHRIRKIDVITGLITTVAGDGFGTGIVGGGRYTGDGGPATLASLNLPTGICFDGTGDLYIADSGNHVIRKVDPTGMMTTVAGDGFKDVHDNGGFGGDGGPATQAMLNYPSGVVVDRMGNLYIAEQSNNRIRKVDYSVDPRGIITTVAGTEPGRSFSGDGGPATQANLFSPTGVVVDGSGNLYIADWGNGRIRKVDTTGIITTIAGNGFINDPPFGGFSGDGGPATLASLNLPSTVVIDGAGNLFIADSNNNRIRKIDLTGIITTVAGSGPIDARRGNGGFPGDGGPATQAGLFLPFGTAVDGTGNLYIADGFNNRIRKVIGIAEPPSTPIIVLSTTVLDFADVLVGHSSEQTFQVSNTGTADLVVTDINDPFFTVSDTAFTIAPGDSHTVIVTFSPTTTGTVVDTLLILSNDPGMPIFHVPVQGTAISPPQPLHLTLGHVFGATGETAAVPLTLTNPTTTPVGGIQFTAIPDDPVHIHFESLSDSVASLGFLAAASTSQETTTVLIYTTGHALIPPGMTTLGRLVYRIDAATPVNTTIPLRFGQILIGDSLAVALPDTGLDGSILVGRRGDFSRDGTVNIFDIIGLVGALLGRLPMPSSDSFAFFVADCNGDGMLNILDIVCQVNTILGIPTKVLADGPTTPVTVSLGDLQTLASGQMAIPVMLQSDGVIAGVQAVFTFDPGQLRVGPPQLMDRATGLTFQSQITDGILRLVVYSVIGQGIATGSGPILLIPVTVLGGSSTAPTLRLSQVVLANRQAQAIPVTLGMSTVKVQALPSMFALKPNRPNPFNPTTQIAYEVPQPVHVTLALYNVLGQEVIRLVDAVQSPGRYVVTWDGRNGQGQPVASGVYLYHLTTSTGFVQTRRMTLVR